MTQLMIKLLVILLSNFCLDNASSFVSQQKYGIFDRSSPFPNVAILTKATLLATVNGASSKSNSDDDKKSSSSSTATAPNRPGFPLYALFTAAARAAVPKPPDTASGAHDAFRFEWGRWVDDGNMAELQDQLNKIKIVHGGKVYDRLLSMEKKMTSPSVALEYDDDGKEKQNIIQDVFFTRDKEARRFRVAGGDNWDCILHVLPKGMEWSGRWPTGSWAVVRALTGLVEIAMLRGPDRDGMMNKVTTMKLRGGGDGTLGSGPEGAGGQDSVKYVGGVQRTYSGVSGKTMLLEVVLRPPIGDVGKDGDGRLSSDIEPLPPEDVLMAGLDDVDEVPLEEEEEKPPKELPREKPAAETTVVQDWENPRQRQPPLDMPLPEPTIPLSEFVPVTDEEFMKDDFDFVRNDVIFEDDFYEENFEGEIIYEDDLVQDRFYGREPYRKGQDSFDPEDDVFDASVNSDILDEPRISEEQGGAMEEDDHMVSLSTKMGMSFKKIGGLDDQLDAIVRRVLATRANPEAAKRLGVNHVRGILLSGPPGCGKTLLARELSEMLGSREPQIVNGPEILDKFVGEAEKNVRALFEPAELEYAQLGDDSALHVIILDELDAIARRRGSVTGDTTGVRDSVVNQLLAKMDGVKEANNVLVIGLTNRPELLDPALLRPGRLEVQLRVDLPDKRGRRDILRIHTARMKEEGGLSWEAQEMLEDLDSDDGIPSKTEYFTGAEIAGLVRSAASFALARTVEEGYSQRRSKDEATVMVLDLTRALSEVKPALGKQDEVLEARFPHGISACSPGMKRAMRDLERFTSTPNLLAKQRTNKFEVGKSPTLQSLLLVGDGYKGGTGSTALACWAASRASLKGEASYVRLITSLDLLAFGGGSSDESARAMALVERFTEASTMANALLVFDDIDQICAGQERKVQAKSLSVIAATSRTDGVCSVLHELFDEVIVVPELTEATSIEKLLSDSMIQMGFASSEISEKAISSLAEMMSKRLEKVGCKTALRLLERSMAMSYRVKERGEEKDSDLNNLVVKAMTKILDDFVKDQEAAARISCNVK
ncbi:ATPase AAA [Nitzschia inconspicua]|uniref:ATPase AAA n=1 Tax=Nitzschia inconspicua TaxID=303405 RepID=A0A9K3KEY3_9STRA|nr:ATPase AAA [Nitzschia inconspicua]